MLLAVMSSSESDSVSNAISACEAVLYPAILMVSAVLYSEIIDSITSLQDYLLEQQLMRK